VSGRPCLLLGWAVEAESAALKLNKLDSDEGSHSKAALCVAFRDYENFAVLIKLE
jgi:hypothetical protein